MKTSECENCKKRYKVSPKGLCYFCYKNKYGFVPTTECYEQGKVKK